MVVDLRNSSFSKASSLSGTKSNSLFVIMTCDDDLIRQVDLKFYVNCQDSFISQLIILIFLLLVFIFKQVDYQEIFSFCIYFVL